MALGKKGNFSSTMSIKDSKDVSAIAVNIKLKDMRIFHGFSPSSHVGSCSKNVWMFLLMSVFFEIRPVSEFLVIFEGHETLIDVGIKINDELLFWIKNESYWIW